MWQFLHLLQCHLAPSQRSRPTAYNASFWQRIRWCDFPTCEVEVDGPIPGRTNCERARNGPGYLFMTSKPKISVVKHIWLHNNQLCVASQICLCGRENRTPLRDLSPWPSWCCPFLWTTQSQRNVHIGFVKALRYKKHCCSITFMDSVSSIKYLLLIPSKKCVLCSWNHFHFSSLFFY